MTQPTSFALSILFLTLAMGSALNSMAQEGAASSEPLYRNGGHFGLAGSDVQLEADGPDAAPAASDTDAAAQTAYMGTLYRNGGHFGEANSDQSLDGDGR